jgi:hypothetical protein
MPSGIVPPWNFDWNTYQDVYGSGIPFASLSIYNKFIDAINERTAIAQPKFVNGRPVFASGILGPVASGVSYLLYPASGLAPLSARINPSGGNLQTNFSFVSDAAVPLAWLQAATFDLSNYYYNLSPSGQPSGIANNRDLRGVFTGSQAETFSLFPSGSVFNKWIQENWKNNIDIDLNPGLNYSNYKKYLTHPFPPPSGFTRKFPREIFNINNPGSSGQTAIFIAMNTSAVTINKYYGDINSPFFGTTTITPIDQADYSGQKFEYTNLGSVSGVETSGWRLCQDQSRRPDTIIDYGLSARGDYFGPWILNEMRDALNLLTIAGPYNASSLAFDKPFPSGYPYISHARVGFSDAFFNGTSYTSDGTYAKALAIYNSSSGLTAPFGSTPLAITTTTTRAAGAPGINPIHSYDIRRGYAYFGPATTNLVASGLKRNLIFYTFGSNGNYWNFGAYNPLKTYYNNFGDNSEPSGSVGYVGEFEDIVANSIGRRLLIGDPSLTPPPEMPALPLPSGASSVSNIDGYIANEGNFLTLGGQAGGYYFMDFGVPSGFTYSRYTAG